VAIPKKFAEYNIHKFELIMKRDDVIQNRSNANFNTKITIATENID
jgi:hypothetical protein